MFQKLSRSTGSKKGIYSTFYLVFSGLSFLSGNLRAVVDEVVVRRPWKTYQSGSQVSEEKVAAQYADALAAVDNFFRRCRYDLSRVLLMQKRKNLRARNTLMPSRNKTTSNKSRRMPRRLEVCPEQFRRRILRISNAHCMKGDLPRS